MSKLIIAFGGPLLCAGVMTIPNAQRAATISGVHGIDNDGAANLYQHDSAGATPGGKRGKKPVAKPIQRITEGKIGDVLFDGRWRFQVVSTQTVDSYTMKTDAEPYDYVNLSRFDLTKRVFTAKAGFTLIVIQ